MRQLRYAFLFILILFTSRLFAACPDGEVELGGSCRDAAWISTNLAEGRDVLAFGICLNKAVDLAPAKTSRSRCAMWFAEETSETSLGIKSTIHFLSNVRCTGGQSSCVGGYGRVARLNLELGIAVSDTNVVTATGTLTIAAGEAASLASPIGSMDWTIHPSSYGGTFYDAGGKTISGYHVSDSLFYFGEERCDETFATLLSDGGVGTPLRDLVSRGADALAANRPVLPGGGRSGHATFEAISGNIGRAVGKAIGGWGDQNRICLRLYADLELPPATSR